MTIQSIGIDSGATLGSNSSSVNQAGSTNFSEIMALGASSVGPVVEQSLLYKDNTGAATIAAATANATYGSAVGSMSSPYLSNGGIGGYSMNPYGGVGFGAQMATTTGGLTASVGGVDTSSMVNQMQATMSEHMMLQLSVQNVSNSYTTVSNVLSQKASTERSMIQNIKT